MKHINVCGTSVPVRVGSEKTDSRLKDAYGLYDLDTGVIWINESTPVGMRDAVLAHEVLHVILNSSGALRVTAMAFGLSCDKPRDLKRMNEWEEAIIRVLTPGVLEAFGAARTSGK
jgi:Zn-dependent peptidase ImmA (M78 family)